MSSEALGDVALDADPSGPGLQAPREQVFSERLRERTKLIHREAERSGFIADLIRGRASREGYALYLGNLVPVYAALETALERAPKTSLVAPFADPGLRRSARLAADLAALRGVGFASTPATAEAGAYAEAIRSSLDSYRLVAHAYARYLGDLSGGQILRPLLARTLALGPDTLSFYDFPAFLDPEVPKASMRRALDGIDATSQEAETLVAEAVAAFRHNIAMSTSVAAALA